ncbi:MAG: type VI secretion system baseplate subunit TssF [Proteobacteria bacterium]|nr:MAG: type VI secretion system baseplate subunit TssF [Pseudomonadota bacterium]
MVSRDDHFYYIQEMRYLNKEGIHFAEKHPDIAGKLGLEGVHAELRDPHSERILEGFAFLTGRIRKMLDRQYPELAHALFNLIFPTYLKPVPAKTIAQFTSREGMLDKPQLIPRGTEIHGQLSDQKVTFTTAHELLVQPMTLDKLYIDPESPSDFSISAVLKVHAGADPQVIDYDEIEFFIHGDPSLRFELFKQLNNQLSYVSIKGLSLPHELLEIQWTGFQPDHSFSPDEDHTFLPLHLIRDYFDQPEKFMLFKIKGLTDALSSLMDDLSDFQIDFHFKTPFATGSMFTSSNLLLHSCPCHNVFNMTSEPLEIDAKQLEYRLIPDLNQPQMEVYSVEKVLVSKERDRHELRPYYHFNRDSIANKEQYFYALRREPGNTGGWETYIRFFKLKYEKNDLLKGYTGSTRIRATQGNFARNVKIGQLNKLDRAIPETISVKNITQATTPCWPNLYTESDWNFISHLALNYRDIQDLESLKKLLTLYNFSNSETITRKINGLLHVEKKRDYIIANGRCINGFTLTLGCDDQKFQHVGDLVLFGRVLGHFLEAYCPFNSFIRLVIEIGHHQKLLETVVTG